jgi:tubulin-specific chaperone D
LLFYLYSRDVCISSDFASLKQGYSEFYSKLVDSVISELKGSKDFTKLCSGLSLLGYISSQLDGTCIKAFSQLVTFLGYRYPR